jgi:hypothetical protein
MGPNEMPHLKHSEGLWFDWFRDGILNADIDDAGEKPVLHYLVDLSVLERDSKGLLKLSWFDCPSPTPESFNNPLLSHSNTLKSTK